jgi:isopentenyl diphosphate isomerase/L-lactate dehydrogenase-like FMN-dependent dehydrogenase
MLRLLREELEVTMALTGCPTLASINSEALHPSGELARIE